MEVEWLALPRCFVYACNKPRCPANRGYLNGYSNWSDEGTASPARPLSTRRGRRSKDDGCVGGRGSCRALLRHVPRIVCRRVSADADRSWPATYGHDQLARNWAAGRHKPWSRAARGHRDPLFWLTDRTGGAARRRAWESAFGTITSSSCNRPRPRDRVSSDASSDVSAPALPPQSWSVANTACFPSTHLSAGTIFFLGDQSQSRHPDGTIEHYNRIEHTRSGRRNCSRIQCNHRQFGPRRNSLLCNHAAQGSQVPRSLLTIRPRHRSR